MFIVALKISLFFLLFTSNCFAGLTIVQHVGHNVASGTTNAATITSTTAGDLIVVAYNIDGNGTASYITDNLGDSIHQFPAASDVADQAQIYYILSCQSGITTITLNYTNSNDSQLEVWEVSGWLTTATIDAGNTLPSGSTSASTDTGAAVTTTGNIEFVAALDHTSVSITANPKAGNEFTSGGDIVNSANGFISLITTTIGSHTPVWSTNSAGFTAVTGSFKDAWFPTQIKNATINNATIK